MSSEITLDNIEDIRDRIISNARQLYKTPFCHRGRTRFGIDCMGVGLVSFRRAGINLPDGDGRIYDVTWFWHEDEERYLENLKRFFSFVEEPKKADILLFRCHSKKITHAGIWMDDQDAFIHAKSGRGVTIDYLSQKYWKNRFAGYMRLKEFLAIEGKE